MKKVLIITNNRKDRSPGQRFRFEQYLDYLNKSGFDIDFSFFISAEDDKILYTKGNYWGKFKIVLKNIKLRTRNVLSRDKYDIIFIFREATILGFSIFEKWLSNGRAKVIFDFDDSIWLDNVSQANKKLAWLKNASKTADIIEASDCVFAGNDYLATYAKQFNKNVVIVPTTIDTLEYSPIAQQSKDKVCIGWSGSITTIEYFKYAVPALQKLKEKYGSKIYFKVIGDGSYKNDELGIKGDPWKKDTEIEDLCEIDIGIMPCPDDNWAKGKCGLKGLQYMALEIPTILSPVGVNSEIIQDGVNGFLCTTTEEWVEKISLLVESAELRKRLGTEGRKTVVEKYSVEANKGLYLKYFKELSSYAL
jgi:glycosyltransferase involved in cell wall biosynthesis